MVERRGAGCRRKDRWRGNREIQLLADSISV